MTVQVMTSRQFAISLTFYFVFVSAEEALKSQHHADLVWDPRIGDHLADDEGSL